MSNNSGQQRSVVRALTLIPAAAVILANIIGTGVFVKARVMTCNVGSPEMVLLVWFLAGVLTLAGALVYAELGAMMPRSGGEYHFIDAAFGKRWAFLYGWTRSIALGASVAATSIITVIFLNDLTGGGLSPLAMQTLPLLVILIVTTLNLLSVHSTGLTITMLTSIKVGLVLMIGLGAFLFADGTGGNFSGSGAAGSCEGVPESAKLGISGFGAAMLGALWGYNGWAIIAAVGGEIKNPGRTLPRALIGGTVVVMTLYLVVNAAYFYVLTPAEVASIPEASSVAGEVAARVFGPGVVALMSAGLMISAYGTTHTSILTSRVPFALAKEGLLPKSLAYISKAGIPSVAVIAVGVWSVCLAVTGTFDILTDMYVFVLWVFFGMNGIALMVLRRRKPNADRPYRVWGYPYVPILFLMVTVYLLLNTIWATPYRALSGLALIVVGLPMYEYFSRRAKN